MKTVDDVLAYLEREYNCPNASVDVRLAILDARVQILDLRDNPSRVHLNYEYRLAESEATVY